MLKLLLEFGSARDLRRQLRTLGVAFALVTLLVAPATAAVDYDTVGSDLVTGLTGAIGLALDEINAHLYFVDYNSGQLKRVVLAPGCETASPPTCAVELVASGFNHPEDVAVDPASNTAFVTTRDNIGNTGELFRVDLATNAVSLVTFNLGAPQQIALDAAADAAYVVGYDIGRLWKIDLMTGAKTTVLDGLDHPVGLLITADRVRAWVTEQGTTNALTEIDLQAGNNLGPLTTGLTQPFFLSWVDAAESGLYLPERVAVAPATKPRAVLVDRLTGISVTAVENLPPVPSDMVVSFVTGAAYLSTNTKIVRVPLVDLPVGDANLVFMAVGEVVSTDICQGYATTTGNPGPFKDAPFGGTMDFFGNLERWAGLGARYYQILVSRDGGPYVAITRSWNSRRWDPVKLRYVSVPVAPIAGDDKYEIAAEYLPPAPNPARWWPPYLMLRWPSGGEPNGLYEFKIELYDAALDLMPSASAPYALPAFHPCTDLVTDPAHGNGLVLLVDNTPPDVDLVSVVLDETGAVLPPCTIVDPPEGCNGYRFVITAHDANRHMHGYRLHALWGKNQSPLIAQDWYTGTPGHVDEEGPRYWSGVSNLTRPTMSEATYGWTAPADCAYTFHLRGWKRTINGKHRILHRVSHQSLTINNAPVSCPSP